MLGPGKSDASSDASLLGKSDESLIHRDLSRPVAILGEGATKSVILWSEAGTDEP